MTDPTWRALLIALIAGLPGILTAVGSLVWTLSRLRDVHTIVNSQRTDMVREIESLKQQLRTHRRSY